MKLKKILSLILCVCMVLGTMSTVAFADDGTTTVAKIGETNYTTLEAAIAEATENDTIELVADASIANGTLEDVKLTIATGVALTIDSGSLTGVSIEGSGTTKFNGTVNFYGDNSVIPTEVKGSFELIVNKGATLLISRFVLGYDRNITVYGDIENAHEFDPTGKTPSLKFNSTSGVSLGGTGTGNITAKDAYIELGSSSWKNSGATHVWNFENCYVNATSFSNNNAPGTDSASWTVTFDNSELAAKNYIKTGRNVTYSFTNGSVAKTGSLRNDGVINIDETSSVTTTAQQNNVVGGLDEHGGNNGTMNVAGTLTIGSNAKTAFEMLGGTLNVDGGEVNLGNNTLTLDADSKLASDGDISGEITAADGAEVEITGGTYTTSNLPEEWVVDGCELKNNGDGTFSVKGPVLSGKGSKEDPYKINNLDDLKAFRDSVNEGNTYKDKYVVLTNDINLTGEVWTPIGTSIYGKTPADSDVKMFAGNFDGGNHTITGLTSENYVPDAEDISDGEYSFGLFGYIYGANISNVKLTNVNINGTTRKDSDDRDVAGSGVAALIGYWYVADGKACVVENCHVLDGTVIASNNMGGLIGFIDSQVSTPQNVDITIINCSNAANVTSEAREAGGVVGYIRASRTDYSPTMAGNITFKDCINTGDITTLAGGGSTCAGGILGRDYNEYSNQQLKITFDGCENSGDITVYASGETHIAGICTEFEANGAWIVVKNSKNTGNIVVENPENASPLYAGGLLSYAGVMDVIKSTSTGTVTVGTKPGNKYVGDASRIAFVDGIDDFNDINSGDTYYLNGGTSPEFEALVDDVANSGGNFNVLVKTAYFDGCKFEGWYDNPEFTGEACTVLVPGVKVYYAKWSEYIAKIDQTAYVSLQDAFDDAENGDVIELIKDIEVINTVVIPAGKNITLDLNGKTISGTHGADYSMIHVLNGAELTVTDTTTEQNGKITYAAGGNNTGAAVWVEGKLTLESGTIEVTGSWNLGFAVDLRPNAWGTAHTVGAFFDMNGGTIKSTDTAVRVASNSSDTLPELGVTFSMNGGSIDSNWDAIFVQHLYAGDLNIDVVNGTVSGDNSAMRIYGDAGSDIDMIVTGGEFKGDIKVADAYKDTDAIAISGGSFSVDPAAYITDEVDAVKLGDDEGYEFPYIIAPKATSTVAVDLEKVSDGLYNIVLKSDGTYPIHEFVAAEFTFKNDSTTVGGSEMKYDVLGYKDENNLIDTTAQKSVVDGEERYIIKIKDAEKVENRLKGHNLTIGQVSFIGQGTINFSIAKGEVDTTWQNTNLGRYYTNADNKDDATDTLKLEDATIVGGSVADITRNVAINVTYNHDLKALWDNNEITVTVKDAYGDIIAPVDDNDISDGYAAFNNVKIGRITVTLEAPGFRKFVYETTLDEDDDATVVLNFWNDVKKDAYKLPIEKGAQAVKHNFVVGDIVMDYIVDKYDLAAVTSYYGMYDIKNNAKYLKYDLNRDGNIDIRDVQYVLHTMGN